jgi:hypothetical protein
LQELLAPSEVWFYSVEWKYIGSKDKESMGDIVEEITGISLEYLNGYNLGRVTIAKRMSWASNRRTTRREDTAYCLLGIFSCNMPLLYGKGQNAFLRL